MADTEKELRIKATADTAAAKASIDSLNVSIKATDTATSGVTATQSKAEQEMAAFLAKNKEMEAQAQSLSDSLKNTAANTGAFGTQIASLLPSLSIWTIALVALPAILKGIDEGTKSLFGALVDFKDAQNLNTEASTNATRAMAAMGAGFIATTQDIQKAEAALTLHLSALHGWTLETQNAIAAMKEFGIKIPEAFDSVKAKAQAFVDVYAAELKKGAGEARAFAEQNKGTLDALESRFITMGEKVPPELKKISDGIGLIPKAEQELEKHQEQWDKLTKSLADLGAKADELSKKLTDNGKAFQDHANKIEQDRQTAIAAIDSTTKKTIADLDLQVKQTEEAHKARAISDTDYFTKINTLVADEAKAKQDAYTAETKINDDAAKDQKKLADDHAVETKRITDDLATLAEKQVDAKKKQEELTEVRRLDQEILSKTQPLLFQAGIDTKLLSDAQVPLAANTKQAAQAHVDLGAAAKSSSSDLTTLEGVADSLIQKYRDLAAAASDAARAVASVASGGGLGGG